MFNHEKTKIFGRVFSTYLNEFERLLVIFISYLNFKDHPKIQPKTLRTLLFGAKHDFSNNLDLIFLK